MPNIEVLKTLPLGKGCTMRLITDHEAPEDSIDKFYSEVTYDGQPDSDVFSVPAHWHKHHDEWILLSKGRASVTIEGKTVVIVAGDDPVFIPRWHFHSMLAFRGEEMVLKERTDPTGEFKGLFFNDFFSMGRSPGLFHVMRSFYDGDTYISLPGNFKALDQLVTLTLGGFAKMCLFSDTKPKIL